MIPYEEYKRLRQTPMEELSKEDQKKRLDEFDRRLNLSKQVLDEVKSYFGDKLFKTVIHRNVRLGEAPSYGKPALLYDANSVGTQDYMQLIEEIIDNGH